MFLFGKYFMDTGIGAYVQHNSKNAKSFTLQDKTHKFEVLGTNPLNRSAMRMRATLGQMVETSTELEHRFRLG